MSSACVSFNRLRSSELLLRLVGEPPEEESPKEGEVAPAALDTRVALPRKSKQTEGEEQQNYASLSAFITLAS
jgi:hypothetical protein